MMTVVVVLSGLISCAAVWYRDHAPVPLDCSQHLSRIAEPIVMVDAMVFADGGSMGLRFVDANQASWDICLEDTRMFADDPGVLEGTHNVILNSFLPRGPDAHRAPISGVEERALLGLLERWSASRTVTAAGVISPADCVALSILE